MRSFESIAKLIKGRRINHPANYSQSDLSKELGYKNGQFISNVERGLCSIPLKMLTKVCEVLDISHEDMKEALMADYEKTLNSYLEGSKKEETVSEKTKKPFSSIESMESV